MDYRREIDGLRALAVLPAILFHAGFETFSGGFVGVDVFFVISGYLIATIILAELEQDKFSIVNFYERRARRILPALFLVMFVCIPFAWLWLLPSDMKDFSQSLVAVSVFASNFLFLRESGYFDTAAELKPLLHTWSLAVEEQYFVIFPLFLMLTWRLGKRWLLILLATVLVTSFAIAQWGACAKTTAAFFLLPTRGWELLIGVFAAFYLFKANGTEFSKGLSEVGGWLGVALILFAVFSYSKTTPFPGLYALVPTIGTVLIILFATQQTTVGKFVGNQVFVGVSLISYSAYLWHQPLFAFARHNGLTEHDKLWFLALSGVSILFAFLSWQYIEKPFRDKKFVDRKKVFGLSLIGTVAFCSMGMLGHYKNGNLGQINAEQSRFLDFFENEIPAWQYTEKNGLLQKYRADCNFYDIPKYRSGNPTNVPRDSISKSCYESQASSDKLVFIWGDSHAQQLNYGLRKHLPNDFELLQVASAGCIAKLDGVQSNINYCEHSNWLALGAIKKLKPRVVIVGQNLKHNSADMDKLSRALLNIGVQKVIFTGPTPHWLPNLPSVIASRFISNTPRYALSGLDKGFLVLDERLKSETLSMPHLKYVSMIDYFCRAEGCLIYYGDNVAEGITTHDYGHLTPIASDSFAKDVLVKFVID
ncbi:MAG: acyltransferase [Nitrosomonas sp.]|nr:acyltransferase [Nitrosomonas sp.]